MTRPLNRAAFDRQARAEGLDPTDALYARYVAVSRRLRWRGTQVELRAVDVSAIFKISQELLLVNADVEAQVRRDLADSMTQQIDRWFVSGLFDDE